MNIGIDIDDTISNSFETYFGDSQVFDIEEMKGNGQVNNIGNIGCHEYVENMYNWDNNSVNRFWDKYFEKTLREATVKSYAPEIIKKLKNENNKIYLITARYEMESIDSVKGLTEEWLRRNNIVYDELVMEAKDKLKVAKEYNLDLFIDDSLKNCKDVSKGNIKTLLYTGIGNLTIDSGNIQKVYSWPQVYNVICKMKNGE